METARVESVKRTIMFVIAWLVGLYIFEIVQEHFHGPIGFAAAAVTVGVNLYARHRASLTKARTFAYKFWVYLPVVLFFAVPIVAKLVAYFMQEEERSWWNHMVSLLPFILKLGVPVAVLLWVYWTIGRMIPEASSTEAIDTPPD
ncbi:MAG: hypothetical protein KJ749_00945 [Planctomycetes bacterium]|nr:hypothetical protein [Planctomycetota bacterium]